ncbi:hypothetical protein K458DRAFT_398912 [Lentithecium fluviatile CBS 122367]|uniref:Uncharacterized protein n=1 Tax=Lentithecium fluviatile CBS 122367 TaxID=1168545 RepID=A0A6G1JL69_9PLEO|nr:hypothetical protein K458DRAFT_398912 [Lentithecium fluviatile CBS 122367]
MSTLVSTDAGGYDVHLGFWTNWSHGKIQGATVTLSRQSGGLLIAFLALFVSATGTSFWRICCFLTHSIYSKDEPQDGLHHQRQAILRNTASAHQGLVSLLWVCYSWRKPKFPLRRILPLSLIAMLIAGAFAIAVLLSGKHCGIFLSEPKNENVSLAVIMQYLTQRTTAFLDRSLQCYSNNRTAKSENCRPYIKPTLPYSVISNASCPFSEEICLSKDINLLLDTGLLNSHDHLGLNAPPSSRFHFRSRVHCAPLATEGYTKVHMNSQPPQIPIQRYYYGGHQANGQIQLDEAFTYQVPVNLSTYNLDNFTSVQTLPPDYMVGAKWTSATAQERLNLFEPIAPLNRSDGMLWLMFLSASGVAFLNPTDDPWFSAHVNTADKLWDPITNDWKPLVGTDQPAGVLGCSAQTQFCTSDTSHCEPLDAADAILGRPISDLWPNPDDQAAIEWAKKALLFSFSPGIGDFLTQLGSSPLLTRFMLSYGLQMGVLPPNQWQKEMEHLFQAQLVSYQDAFVAAASGPFSPEMEINYIQPNGSSQVRMCTNQKIFSGLYYSFNVLGLSIILVIGTLIITLDLTIEPLLTYIDKRRKNPRHTYSRLEWHANSTLQLQRLTFEELSLGTWTRCIEEVPITEEGELLGLLDISDESHPRLKRSGVDRTDTEGTEGTEGTVDHDEKKGLKTTEVARSASESSTVTQDKV